MEGRQGRGGVRSDAPDRGLGQRGRDRNGRRRRRRRKRRRRELVVVACDDLFSSSPARPPPPHPPAPLARPADALGQRPTAAVLHLDEAASVLLSPGPEDRDEVCVWRHARDDADLAGRSLAAYHAAAAAARVSSCRNRGRSDDGRGGSGTGTGAAPRLDGVALPGTFMPREPDFRQLRAADDALELEGAREGEGLRVEQGGGRVEERGGGGGDLLFFCFGGGRRGRRGER